MPGTLAVYVDAVEWVELPNTHGMSQYADGGREWAASLHRPPGKYIQRMSRTARAAVSTPRSAAATNACPFTTLYWDFLMRHQAKLAKNPRMALQVKNVARLTDAQRQAVIRTRRGDPPWRGRSRAARKVRQWHLRTSLAAARDQVAAVKVRARCSAHGWYPRLGGSHAPALAGALVRHAAGCPGVVGRRRGRSGRVPGCSFSLESRGRARPRRGRRAGRARARCSRPGGTRAPKTSPAKRRGAPSGSTIAASSGRPFSARA